MVSTDWDQLCQIYWSNLYVAIYNNSNSVSLSDSLVSIYIKDLRNPYNAYTRTNGDSYDNWNVDYD